MTVGALQVALQPVKTCRLIVIVARIELPVDADTRADLGHDRSGLRQVLQTEIGVESLRTHPAVKDVDAGGSAQFERVADHREAAPEFPDVPEIGRFEQQEDDALGISHSAQARGSGERVDQQPGIAQIPGPQVIGEQRTGDADLFFREACVVHDRRQPCRPRRN